ncbi:probable serine/threonine-protein kinase dyrk2 [Symsagittifera roscoffensis]|uniref:probable serine/threonine-protein kinase dyrk2 n=1 Tax=Symsagittifera roscoffensis TaxID=84072 RepID=UPI00307C3A17
MASSSGNVRLNTASKTTSGSRKSVQKANEQAPWKNSRKTSRDNQEYTNKFNKASLDNSISATNGVGFLNEWKWSASGTLRQDSDDMFSTHSKSVYSSSRTNSVLTSPSPPHLPRDRESCSSGSDRNSIKSPRRKLKSPFNDQSSLLPSKPCVTSSRGVVDMNNRSTTTTSHRAPPSTKDLQSTLTKPTQPRASQSQSSYRSPNEDDVFAYLPTSKLPNTSSTSISTPSHNHHKSNSSYRSWFTRSPSSTESSEDSGFVR